MAERLLLFIPAYRCEAQLPRVIAQLDGPMAEWVTELLVVDNQSPDGTVAAARAALGALDGLRWTILRNDANYGLGGSHKVAIAYGQEHGFETLVVLHGDDQARVDDLVPLLRAGAHGGLDALLGARFARGATLQGYSRVRTVGNHVYNALFSLASRRRFFDLGSGLNLFRLEAFADGAHRRFADDLTFNYHLCLHMAARGWRIRFFPILWRETDQRSNVKLAEQGRRTFGLLGRFVRDREAFLATDFSTPGAAYTAHVVARS